MYLTECQTKAYLFEERGIKVQMLGHGLKKEQKSQA